MILGGVGYRRDLLRCKPALQLSVRANDACRVGVMQLAAILQARVVIRCSDIYHLLVNLKATCELCAALNYLQGVVAAMASVERVVEGKDILFDVCYYFGTYHSAQFLRVTKI